MSRHPEHPEHPERSERSEHEPLDAADLAVLTDLRRIMEQVDPVPPGLVERSLFALTLEGLHVELMELGVWSCRRPASGPPTPSRPGP